MGLSLDFCFAGAPSPSRRASIGIDRPAPLTCGAAANWQVSSLLSPRRSVVLGFVIAVVGGLAARLDDRPARDGFALAPTGLVADLGGWLTCGGRPRIDREIRALD